MLPRSAHLRGTTGDMLSQDATLTTSKLSKIQTSPAASKRPRTLVPVTIYRSAQLDRHIILGEKPLEH
jgi:hypothetical protein